VLSSPTTSSRLCGWAIGQDGPVAAVRRLLDLEEAVDPCLVEVGVGSAAADEFLWGAVFEDASRVDDEHAVGDLNGREAVGDYHRGPVGEQGPQRSLY
jgi:hypothetical protein